MGLERLAITCRVKDVFVPVSKFFEGAKRPDRITFRRDEMRNEEKHPDSDANVCNQLQPMRVPFACWRASGNRIWQPRNNRKRSREDQR
jgi:hypothetical protein